MDKKRIAMLSAVVLMIAALTAVSLLAVRQKKINSMYDVKPLTEKQLSEIAVLKKQIILQMAVYLGKM